MKPVKRYGLNSNVMTVITDDGHSIGHYYPDTGDFAPNRVENWSMILVERVTWGFQAETSDYDCEHCHGQHNKASPCP